jgi:hypothetical protein
LNDKATNTATLKAPDAVTTSYELTLPVAQATAAGQVLVNNGTGTLTWVTLPTSVATAFLSPVEIYKATPPATAFPVTPIAYPGSGMVVYSPNEAIKLKYTVSGVKVGYIVSATPSATFEDKIIIAKIKVVADDTVEVLTGNGFEETVTPADLMMTFSYVKN